MEILFSYNSCSFLFFQVEKCRHVLLLREKLAEQNKTHELSKMDKEITNMNKKEALAKIEHSSNTDNLEVKEKLEESITEKEDDTTEKDKFSLLRDNSYYNFQTDGEVEKELMAKCLRLILQGRLPPVPVGVKVGFIVSAFS